jgi:hypothetical protein
MLVVQFHPARRILLPSCENEFPEIEGGRDVHIPILQSAVREARPSVDLDNNVYTRICQDPIVRFHEEE